MSQINIEKLREKVKPRKRKNSESPNPIGYLYIKKSQKPRIISLIMQILDVDDFPDSNVDNAELTGLIIMKLLESYLSQKKKKKKSK